MNSFLSRNLKLAAISSAIGTLVGVGFLWDAVHTEQMLVFVLLAPCMLIFWMDWASRDLAWVVIPLVQFIYYFFVCALVQLAMKIKDRSVSENRDNQ
jgi:uncharacterized membrane protein YhiD involved in acid resistance